MLRQTAWFHSPPVVSITRSLPNRPIWTGQRMPAGRDALLV